MVEKSVFTKHRYHCSPNSWFLNPKTINSDQFLDDPILSESSLLAFKTQRPKRLGEDSFSHHWGCSGNTYFPTSGGEQIGSGGKSPTLSSVSPQHQARPSGWFCPMYVRGRDPPQSLPGWEHPRSSVSFTWWYWDPWPWGLQVLFVQLKVAEPTSASLPATAWSWTHSVFQGHWYNREKKRKPGYV